MSIAAEVTQSVCELAISPDELARVCDLATERTGGCGIQCTNGEWLVENVTDRIVVYVRDPDPDFTDLCTVNVQVRFRPGRLRFVPLEPPPDSEEIRAAKAALEPVGPFGMQTEKVFDCQRHLKSSERMVAEFLERHGLTNGERMVELIARSDYETARLRLAISYLCNSSKLMACTWMNPIRNEFSTFYQLAPGVKASDVE